MTPKSACLALAAALACIGQVQTASAFDLRDVTVRADWASDPDDDGTKLFQDSFNNNDPQTVAGGQGYLNGLRTPNPLYNTALSSVAGAESTPGDLSIDGNALGQLRFSQANAYAPTPITVNGAQFVDQSNRVRLNDPVGAASIFNTGRSNFVVSTAWTFVTPEVNSNYGMRLTEPTSTGDSFNDRISMEIVRLNDGSAGAQIRRVAGGDGVGSLTVTERETRSLSSALDSGYTIDQVNLIAMHMYWYADTNLVNAELELLRVTNGGATIAELGQINFSNRYEIFRGETTTALQAGASWTTPIPEPSTGALMLLGLAGTGALAKRRRAA